MIHSEKSEGIVVRLVYFISFKLLLPTVLIASGLVAPAFADVLPEPVVQALQRHGLTKEGLSVYVHVVGEREPLIEFAADRPRNPASTIKLLTTLVALEELGPAYKWKTEVYALAPVREGRLDGDVYLKGYGDPYLVVENFWRLLRSLKFRGIQTIAGDLVLDSSYFSVESNDQAEFDGQTTRAYNALPDALLVNFQATHVRLHPSGKQVQITTDPPIPLLNRLKLLHAPCYSGRHSWRLRVREVQGRVKLLFDGQYADGCGDHELFRVALRPEAHIFSMFQALWGELGGRLEGGVRTGLVPEQARLLYTGYSPPLADVIRSINKYSNNVMTRQLLLTLGAERGGMPGTTTKGIAAIGDWLSRHGLDFSELVLENGAGLSRDERISARHLGELLLFAYKGAYMPELVSSLPVSGVDGTLKRRFSDDLSGRMHLKTGSLNDVRSVAGYVLDQAGRWVVVVCLHNHPKADSAAGESVQDALLKWVYARPTIK